MEEAATSEFGGRREERNKMYLGFRVKGLGFRVYGLGFSARVLDLGSRV